MHTAVVFGIAMCLAGAGFDESAAPQSPPGAWPIHSNPALGYELRHPGGYAVFATGPEGERDGSRIRVALEEYAAPAPVLDIYVRHGAAAMQMPGAVRRHWHAEDTDVDMAGSRCAMTTYRFGPGGRSPSWTCGVPTSFSG